MGVPLARVTTPLKADKFRFAVGDDGKPWSSAWWIATQNNNTYLAAKAFGHAIKVSFHGDDGSLVCQVAHTQPYYKKRIAGLPDDRGRSFVRWHRAATPADRLLHVGSIHIVTDTLSGQRKKGRPGKPLVVMPPGPPGTEVEVGVFYSRLTSEHANAKLTNDVSKLIGSFTLPNGDIVHIAGRVQPHTPQKTASGQPIVGASLPLRTRHWTDEEKQEAIRRTASKAWSAVTFNSPRDGEVLHLYEYGGLTLGPPLSATSAQ